MRQWRWIGLAALGLAVLVGSAGVVTSHASDPVDGLLYWPSYHRGQKALLSRLNDPESARLRNLYFHRRKGVQYLCGFVNARNRMGGYTGYTRFYVAHVNHMFPEVVVGDGRDDGSETSVRHYCTQ